MTVLIVDDEPLVLKMMTNAVREALPEASLHSFTAAAEAAAFAEEHPVQIAFLDIRLRGTTGTELAARLQALQPQMNIIFCTAYDEYKSTAMDLHASGYLMKPVQAEDILRELKMLRFPLPAEEPAAAPPKRLRAVCFGDFRITYAGSLLPFRYQKTGELLAVLIDRNGALCSSACIMECIWEEGEQHLSYLKQLRSDLKNTLCSIGMESALRQQRGLIGIDPEMFDCDYFDFLAGKPEAVSAYDGAYMAQFSWAEETNARLYWRKQELLSGTNAAEMASL